MYSFFIYFFIYKLQFIFTQEYLTWSHSVQSTLLSKAKCYCLASQRTVYKNECISKTNLCKQFKSILCSSKVFYASFFTMTNLRLTLVIFLYLIKYVKKKNNFYFCVCLLHF